MIVAIGIDPGKDGAMVALNEKREVLSRLIKLDQEQIARKWPVQAAKNWPQAQIFIERAQSMPLNKASAMFNYGSGYGYLRGILAMTGLAHTLVPPAAWSKHMHAGTKIVTKLKNGVEKVDTKARSLEAARNLFPDVELREEFHNGKFSKHPHDGFVDALLIAEFGLRRLLSFDAVS